MYGLSANKNLKETPMATATEPNLYELKGGALRVTYSTTSITGKPSFTYQQGVRPRALPNEIQIRRFLLGHWYGLVEAVPDLKTVTFSLASAVNLQQKPKVKIKTIES
jgi:hypothetical protein